ncbi:Ail/Lom family outer membrane beta-barrel protein [Shigella flexneri]
MLPFCPQPSVLAVSGAPAWASEHQSTLSAGYLMPRRTLPAMII